MTEYNLRDPNTPTSPLNRQQMQNEALIIKVLIEAAIALDGGVNPSDAFEVLSMAYDRASHLDRALDLVNQPELQV